MSDTDVSQILCLEKEIAEYIGTEYATAVNSKTAAIHLAVKLAAEKIYGANKIGCLQGRKVFCPDFCSAESVYPVLYEGGEPVFIDASLEDWGMDADALSLAFERYPEVKIVIYAHAYGFPGSIDVIDRICKEHGALLIEDAGEALGAVFDEKKAGSFGDYGIIDFNGAYGGMLLSHDRYSAEKARRWVNGSNANAPWHQHEEAAYPYRITESAAESIRKNLSHLDDLIAARKKIYERYMEAFDEDILLMNPMSENTEPSYSASCILCESSIQFKETRSEREYTYESQHGTASPMEIYDALKEAGFACAPVWKPMHMQPLFAGCDQISVDGSIFHYADFYQDDFLIRANESKELFEEGLCLPCEPDLTEDEQRKVIEIVKECFE